jgi:hypothetical protein
MNSRCLFVVLLLASGALCAMDDDNQRREPGTYRCVEGEWVRVSGANGETLPESEERIDEILANSRRRYMEKSARKQKNRLAASNKSALPMQQPASSPALPVQETHEERLRFVVSPEQKADGKRLHFTVSAPVMLVEPDGKRQRLDSGERALSVQPNQEMVFQDAQQDVGQEVYGEKNQEAAYQVAQKDDAAMQLLKLFSTQK